MHEIDMSGFFDKSPEQSEIQSLKSQIEKLEREKAGMRSQLWTAQQHLNALESVGLGDAEEVARELQHIIDLVCPEYEGEESLYTLIERLHKQASRAEDSNDQARLEAAGYTRAALSNDSGNDLVRREDWEASQQSLAEMRAALERIVSPYSPAEIEEMKTLHHGRSAGEISIKDVLVCIEALNLNQPSQDWVRKSEAEKIISRLNSRIDDLVKSNRTDLLNALEVIEKLKSRAETAEERLEEVKSLLVQHMWREDFNETGCETGHYSCVSCGGAGNKRSRDKNHAPDCKLQFTLAKGKEKTK